MRENKSSDTDLLYIVFYPYCQFNMIKIYSNTIA